jgi:uncharacterized protein
MVKLLSGLSCKVCRVLVTECTHTLFYSRIHAVSELTGAVVDVDARPSDAINLALRMHAPVLVRNSVLQKYAKDE